MGYLGSLSTTLQDAEVDWPVYAELSEKVRRVKDLGLNARETQIEIINAMNRSITISQGQTFIDSLAKRDVFAHPVVKQVFTEIEELRKSGILEEEPIEHLKLLNDLFEVIVKTDGNVDKVRTFMDDILLPPIRKSGFKRLIENIGWAAPTPAFELKPSPIAPFMLEWETTEINYILATDEELKDLNLTVDKLNDEDARSMLKYIRSKSYQRSQSY